MNGGQRIARAENCAELRALTATRIAWTVAKTSSVLRAMCCTHISYCAGNGSGSPVGTGTSNMLSSVDTAP